VAPRSEDEVLYTANEMALEALYVGAARMAEGAAIHGFLILTLNIFVAADCQGEYMGWWPSSGRVGVCQLTIR